MTTTDTTTTTDQGTTKGQPTRDDIEPRSAEGSGADGPDKAPDPSSPVLAHLDQTVLLVDLNIREARLDKPFVASVKRHGVLVPIVAVTTGEGVRVRMGHRRTLAAVEAGLTTVPVYLTGAEDDDTAARIVAQWSENEHRAALTNPERVEAINQLSLYGLSAAQIATRTATAKGEVAAALTVAGNALAAKAVDRYDFLTLDQAAALTRFEHDTDAVTALVAAAQLGPVQFNRVLAKADDDAAQRAAEAERRAPVLAQLAAEDCPVLEDPDWSVRSNHVVRWSTDGAGRSPPPPTPNAPATPPTSPKSTTATQQSPTTKWSSTTETCGTATRTTTRTTTTSAASSGHSRSPSAPTRPATATAAPAPDPPSPPTTTTPRVRATTAARRTPAPSRLRPSSPRTAAR